MDVRASESDTSVNLDSTWFVLNENDVKQCDTPNITDLLGRNIDSESSNSEINDVDEDSLINSAIPPTEVSKIVEEKEEVIENKEESEARVENNQLLPVVEQYEDISNIYEETFIVYRPEFNKNIEDFFFLLASISVGTFFITICGLSLMFMNHNNALINENNQTSCADSTKQYYTISNNNNTWFNNFYRAVDEEELIKRYCPNKYKQSYFKKKLHSKNDRHLKQSKTQKMKKLEKEKEEKKMATKIIEDDEAQDAEFRYLKSKLDEQMHDYETLKTDFNRQSLNYEELKKQCRMKNELNRRCVQLMLKEIVGLNKELKQFQQNKNCGNGKGDLNPPTTVNSDTMTFEPSKPSISSGIVGREFLNINLNTSVPLSREEHERAKQLIKNKIKEMMYENDNISESIKISQKKLQELKNHIASRNRFLEYKRFILATFQDRLGHLESMDKSYEDKEDICPVINPCPPPVDIPLQFMDDKIQKSMSPEMLDVIMNNTLPQNKNICLCEQEDYSSNSCPHYNNSFSGIIARDLAKLADNQTPAKPTCVAKWDDKTIWFSRRLNDREHSRLTSMYPKCNPAKGWVKARKFVH